MPNARPRGLILDMDGTIVDNMRFHDAAWAQWHAQHGLPFDEPTFFRRTAGRANPEIIAELMPGIDATAAERLSLEKEDLYREAYRPHVRPLAGLMALIEAAEARGMPLAIATAAPPDNIAIIVDTLDLRRRVVTIVSPSMGYRGKPHPDLFLAAADAMALAPADCLVFEDAPLGIEAARRAGMPAVAITTMLPAEAFADYPNLVAAVADFADPRVVELVAGDVLAA